MVVKNMEDMKSLNRYYAFLKETNIVSFFVYYIVFIAERSNSLDK